MVMVIVRVADTVMGMVGVMVTVSVRVGGMAGVRG